MENLKIYEAVRTVPATAIKPIKGGRLKGKSDLNPMWRIKTLTEQFGVCGIGWYTEITRQWIEQYENGESAAFCDINLYIKSNGEWSKAIPGIGGAMFAAKESGGFYVDDDCYKKAYTDAISVSCKALGIGADVYWEQDATKYTPKDTQPAPEAKTVICPQCNNLVKGIKANGKQYMPQDVLDRFGCCYKCYSETKATPHGE